jgi:hypothetical protein
MHRKSLEAADQLKINESDDDENDSVTIGDDDQLNSSNSKHDSNLVDPDLHRRNSIALLRAKAVEHLSRL